jgi:signal transduction histidine kinase
VEEEKVLSGNQPVASCIEKFEAGPSTRWYSTNRAPIRGQNGSIVGLVAVRHDITDQKLQVQMKDEFIATVTHELRTPLTSMGGALGLLDGGAICDLPQSALHLIKIARANCQRLNHLVNDILDIENIETCRLAFNLRPVESHALVEQAIETNQSLAKNFGVRVRLDSKADHGVVHADFERLTQAVKNILSNAVKFSPRGSEVIVTIENNDAGVRISVRDHGPGIPDEYKDRIFDKFVQVDATDARQKGGTGLGLSIVKEIVSRLGGKVYFESAPGNGTIFHIVLPRQDHAMFDADPKAHERRETAPTRAAG